jgi:hypothetical protein
VSRVTVWLLVATVSTVLDVAANANSCKEMIFRAAILPRAANGPRHTTRSDATNTNAEEKNFWLHSHRGCDASGGIRQRKIAADTRCAAMQMLICNQVADVVGSRVRSAALAQTLSSSPSGESDHPDLSDRRAVEWCVDHEAAEKQLVAFPRSPLQR